MNIFLNIVVFFAICIFNNMHAVNGFGGASSATMVKPNTNILVKPSVTPVNGKNTNKAIRGSISSSSNSIKNNNNNPSAIFSRDSNILNSQKGEVLSSAESFDNTFVPRNKNTFDNNIMMTDSIPVAVNSNPATIFEDHENMNKDINQNMNDNNAYYYTTTPSNSDANQFQQDTTTTTSSNQKGNTYSNTTAFGAGALTGAVVAGSVAVFLTRSSSSTTASAATGRNSKVKKNSSFKTTSRSDRLSTPLMATTEEVEGGNTSETSTSKENETAKVVEEEKPKQPIQAKWKPGEIAPDYLDGTFAGDVGFDPLGLGKDDIKAMRDAEMKHGRIAMLAAAGWPISELWHKNLANTFHLPNQLGENGMTPSILNGYGSSPAFLAGAYIMALGIGSFFELSDKKENKENPADKGFDPMGLKNLRYDSGLYKTEKEGQFAMELAEVKHGRLAMLAITSFILQELIEKQPVVQQTPQFF